MLRRITFEQLLEWQRFFEIEPPEELRADYRAASIRHAIYDLFRDTKIHPQPAPLDDFRLKWVMEDEAPKKPTKTWQQMKQIAYAIATIANRKPK